MENYRTLAMCRCVQTSAAREATINMAVEARSSPLPCLLGELGAARSKPGAEQIALISAKASTREFTVKNLYDAR